MIQGENGGDRDDDAAAAAAAQARRQSVIEAFASLQVDDDDLYNNNNNNDPFSPEPIAENHHHNNTNNLATATTTISPLPTLLPASSSSIITPDPIAGIDFTDQELLDALNGLSSSSSSSNSSSAASKDNEGDDSNNRAAAALWETEKLPDITQLEDEFDYNDSLLDDNLDCIFDNNNKIISEEGAAVLVSPEQQQRAAAAAAANNNNHNEDVLDLLEQLGDLSLLHHGREETAATSSPTVIHRPDDDGLPPYLYCQPCGAAPDVDDDNDLYQQQEQQLLLDQDMDELLRELGEGGYSQQNLYLEETFTPHMLDPVIDDKDKSDDNMHNNKDAQNVMPASSSPPPPQQQQQQQAAHLRLFQDACSSSTNERLCLGHTERILGASFSPDGTLLATASQDGTAKVWDFPTNTLVATLKATSPAQNDNDNNEYECLRVAWASSSWGQEQRRWPLNDNNNDNSDSGSQRQLRYVLATAGADGWVHVWGSSSSSQNTTTTIKFELLASLDHAELIPTFEPQDETDRPQVYALQFIDHWNTTSTALSAAVSNDDPDDCNNLLLTSSEDYVHLWELDASKKSRISSSTFSSSAGGTTTTTTSTTTVTRRPQWHLREVLSLRFGDLHHVGYGVTVGQVSSGNSTMTFSSSSAGQGPSQNNVFGGEHRNPHNLVFVFDASYCPHNNNNGGGLLGVALSDGTLRLMNGRGVCLSVLQLPGMQSQSCACHLTSLAWDQSGQRLVTTVATGHLITWNIVIEQQQQQVVLDNDNDEDQQQQNNGLGNSILRASCCAVLQGGHDPGRPLFGAAYCGGTNTGNNQDDLILSWGVDGRLCVWDSQARGDIDAPLAVLLHKPDYPIYAVDVSTTAAHGMVVAGGGNNGGFIGIPVYLYDFKKSDDDKQQSKKAKTSK